MSKEPDSIIDGLKISYAGYLGELKICKSMFLKQSANLLKSGSSSDFEEIKDLLKKTKIKRKTIIKLTNVEINKYWSDICLVANLLMMNEKISFILLRKVLTEYSINKEFWSSKIKLAPRKKRDMITV